MYYCITKLHALNIHSFPHYSFTKSSSFTSLYYLIVIFKILFDNEFFFKKKEMNVLFEIYSICVKNNREKLILILKKNELLVIYQLLNYMLQQQFFESFLVL